MPTINKKMISEQAGFRSGKSYTIQVLHPTQRIEYEFETKKITGAVFVDLCAAYDTINLRKLKRKVNELTLLVGIKLT
jgi:hypothetical protein